MVTDFMSSCLLLTNSLCVTHCALHPANYAVVEHICAQSTILRPDSTVLAADFHHRLLFELIRSRNPVL